MGCATGGGGQRDGSGQQPLSSQWKSTEMKRGSKQATDSVRTEEGGILDHGPEEGELAATCAPGTNLVAARRGGKRAAGDGGDGS